MTEKTNVLQTHFNELMNKDIWHAHELGLSLSSDSSEYLFPFSKIQIFWLKKAAKQFIYSQAPTRTYNTCRAYLKALTTFGCFIIGLKPHIDPKDMTRKVIVDYIHYLYAIKQFKPTTISLYLVCLKRFFEINLQEKWLTFSNSPIIYNEDFPKIPKPIPKFIPECVIQQLLEHLPILSEQHRHLVVIFLETGRRRSEILTLAYDCLHQDNEDDYFMKVNDRKMGKSYMIPITQNCVEHIKQQQMYVNKLTSSKKYLFVTKRKNGIQPMKSCRISDTLNKLAKEKNIVDDNDHLWHFHLHQFRHTVGTRMINAEVPQHIVQRFLGHASAEMTSRYATVHDSTLKKEFVKFQEQLSIGQEEDVLQTALSDASILVGYKQQLETIKKLVAMAKLKGWGKQLKMNLEKQQQLEKTIATIERGEEE